MHGFDQVNHGESLRRRADCSREEQGDAVEIRNQHDDDVHRGPGDTEFS